MKTHAEYRNLRNWLYRLIKHYKHRAQKFEIEAKTIEERRAWAQVILWFNSILEKKRCTTPKGAIGLPKQVIREEIEACQNCER